MAEKYFVATEADEPVAIYFTMQMAKDSGADYIDVFDETGKKVKVLQRTPGEANQYTLVS